MEVNQKAAISDLLAAIERLSEKVDRGNDLAEAILDELIPIGLALDELAAADLPETKD